MKVQGDRLLIFPSADGESVVEDDCENGTRLFSLPEPAATKHSTAHSTLQSFLRRTVSSRGSDLRSLELSCVPLAPAVVDALARLLMMSGSSSLPSLTRVSVSACPGTRRSTARLLEAILHGVADLTSLTWHETSQAVYGEDNPGTVEENENGIGKDISMKCSEKWCNAGLNDYDPYNDSNTIRAEPFCQLQTLKLRASITCESIWIPMLKCLILGPSHATTSLKPGLKNLTLDGSSFDADAIAELASTLSHAQTLKSLQLKWCGLSDESICEIVDAMQHVEHLDLSGNSCMDSGMAAVGRLLCRSELQSLDLSHRARSSSAEDLEGSCGNLSILFDSLRSSITSYPIPNALHTLRLSGNRLCDEDTVHIAEILETMSAIRVLDVSNNSIGNYGIQTLAGAVEHHAPKLRELYLKGNPFGIVGVESLANLVQHRHVGLEIIDLERKCFKAITRRQHSRISRRYFVQPRMQYIYFTCSPLELVHQQNLDSIYQEYRACHEKIVYYTALNAGGRRLLRDDAAVPQGLWPQVLARAWRVGPNRQTALSTTQFLLMGPALANRGDL